MNGGIILQHSVWKNFQCILVLDHNYLNNIFQWINLQKSITWRIEFTAPGHFTSNTLCEKGFLLIGTPLIGWQIPPLTVTRPLRTLWCDRTVAEIMKNYQNVQNFIIWGCPCPPLPGETLLYWRQKNKRLPLTSSEKIFLNILCSKNFFSNEKIGKCPWKIWLTQRLTQLCFPCE